MANDINKEDPHYKGEYGSIYEVNRKFPTGGVAGDFVVIDGWAHYWNADRGTWCVNAERDCYWDELITNLIEKFKLVRGATYMGVASLDTVPTKVIGVKMYYFATVAGTYKNFDNLVVPQGINVLYSDNGSSWVNTTLLEVAQELGVSTNKVMSQKAVSNKLNDLENNYAKNEVVENIDKQVGIVSGSYQFISRVDILGDIWKKGFKINTLGQEEANPSYFVTDFIDVANISDLGFCTKNFANVINIAAYSDKDEDTFIADNSIGNLSDYEHKVICGIWTKKENTKFIKLCMYPFREGFAYSGFTIYKYNIPCYVSYNFLIKNDATIMADGYKHKGYVIPYNKKGLYVDYTLDASSTVEGQVYYKIYIFSKDFKCINKAGAAIISQNFFDNDSISKMLLDGYTLDGIGFFLVHGAFGSISIHTEEDDIKIKRNLFSTLDRDLSTKYSDKLIEAENIKCKNIESVFNIEYKDVVVVKIKNQSDLENLLFEHQENGTKTGNTKSGLYKAIEDNYATHKNYIVEFYDGVYLLADANYNHGLYFINNIFLDHPNVNLLFRNASGNNNVVLLSDGLQYTFNNENITVNKRDKVTGLKEVFNLQPIIFPTHYAVEYKGDVDKIHLSKFVDDNFEEVEISSLKDITIDNCVYDYDYTWENNIGKFKLPSDLTWLNLTEQQCELTYCYFRCTDGYTSARGKVIKIEDGYVYISSQRPSLLAPYCRVKIYNLPILQSNRITIRKDDGVTRIYLPNRRKIFECINTSGMIFYGRDSYKPNSITLYGLNIFGFGKFDRELNPVVMYHGEACIASGGCNIRVNNCYFKNMGGKSIYIRDTEKAMNTEYCLVDNNKFFNTEGGCVNAKQLKGIVSVNNNNFKFCGLNVLGTASDTIAADSEVGTYIFKNKIIESNSSSVIHASSSGSIVIVEDNYIKNSSEFIANYKKSLMMSDTGVIYVANRAKAIIRNNYIDGVFGDYTYRVIYCDDGSWDKTVYGNMILRADIENDGESSGSIFFNPQSVEKLKNSNNIIINNIVSKKYYIIDAVNVERPCYVGKNLLIGIGAGQVSTNSTVQNLENDIADKQVIIQDGELYTELDVSKMFMGGEAIKHIHTWKNINK